ncbi:Pyrimidine-specific ribonucleoside hydrolase rihB [Dermatophilus congolensis]|uniref:Pyrimidine-specific ribonucleoside hydrolase rihB n=1 Tax=Dermatophilus congolensis TaxID=1863 RepID=A0AA46BL79_9MICO|nr:nucleoside hydrolase [Dermatophilus congolensis]STD03431.1 Pyrimidine-specific ribonucleoside hydrolase rihB [Dermatophilus congolensis]
MNATPTIILDCDPGIDDAIAILLAQGHPDINLAAITTVGGNSSLHNVTHNALALATLSNITAPIAAGCAQPLNNTYKNATHIHGTDGIGGITLPTPDRSTDPRHGAQLIIDTIMTNDPDTITLVPIGPMTNIATAITIEPRIINRIHEVVFMGGSHGTGNVTPVAEFNIHADPEAASIVLNADWPITMIGLDLTRQAIATPEVITSIRNINTTTATLVADLLNTYSANYRTTGSSHTGAIVHDPCAVARVLAPTLITCIPAPIHVEQHGTLTRGMTVTDLRTATTADCHTRTATHLNTDGFWELVRTALRHLP